MVQEKLDVTFVSGRGVNHLNSLEGNVEIIMLVHVGALPTAVLVDAPSPIVLSRPRIPITEVRRVDIFDLVNDLKSKKMSCPWSSNAYYYEYRLLRLKDACKWLPSKNPTLAEGSVVQDNIVSACFASEQYRELSVESYTNMRTDSRQCHSGSAWLA